MAVEQLKNLILLLPVAGRGSPVSREDEEALRYNGIEKQHWVLFDKSLE